MALVTATFFRNIEDHGHLHLFDVCEYEMLQEDWETNRTIPLANGCYNSQIRAKAQKDYIKVVLTGRFFRRVGALMAHLSPFCGGEELESSSDNNEEVELHEVCVYCLHEATG